MRVNEVISASPNYDAYALWFGKADSDRENRQSRHGIGLSEPAHGSASGFIGGKSAPRFQ